MSTYGYFKHDEMSGYAISHHGIKGQKWGIRRFQNEDGSLTRLGMARYRTGYIDKNPSKNIRTAKAAAGQSNMYEDIKKTITKESLKGTSKDEIENKVKEQYRKMYGENGDLQYEAGKNSNEYAKKAIIPATFGGLIGSTIYGTVQAKNPNSSLSKWQKSVDELSLRMRDNLKNNYVNVGKSYEKKNGEYKRPKTRQDAIDIIKYDRDKSQKKGSGFGGTFYESGGILNPVHQLIYHYSDKNGNVALSYCRVPGQGDIYVKGSGNINDLDMNKLFKKPPKKIED